MALIAIADIHGNLRALDDVLRKIEPEAGRGDTIVFLGDLIDRGPDSKGCIDRILDLRRTSKAEVVALLGNHEQWLLETFHDHTRHSWLLCMEGVPTIQSYAPDAAAAIVDEIGKLGARVLLERVSLPYEKFFAAVPPEHIEFWCSLKTFHPTPEAVCVHGGLNPAGGPPETQPAEHLIWGTNGFPDDYRGDDRIVYGHWGNAVLDDEGWPHPRIVRRTYGLDTISYGVLTALRLPDGAVFQSRRYESRRSN